MAWEYREFEPPDDLRAVVACLWEQRPEAAFRRLVVPDGCVDLIWMAEQELVVAGADTGPRSVSLPAGRRTSGLRLRPGAAGSVLGIPASEVRDSQVGGEFVAGLDVALLADALAAATPEGRLRLLAAAARAQRVKPDPLVVAAAGRLARAGFRVAAVAAGLGTSERQLHRRTLAAVGYSPKVLARVLRLRRLTRASSPSMVDRALAAGDASQAHMSDEVRRLTGLTATEFLARFAAV
jgi:AraC-like DNA-binding protein